MATASAGEERVIVKAAAGMVMNGGTSPTLFEEMKVLKEMQDQNGGVRKAIHTELWHACAGPLVYLPQVGSLVYYFPQGHSEQVAASTKRSATTQIPNYPNLPSQLLCQVHNVTLHADRDTDEIFAQMSLQPVKSEKDIFQVPDFGLRVSKQPTEYFCKTLTASDTSTHGGFSVPRRAAEKLFPPLDYTMQPPSQELVVRDLHENTWTFRHIYRGQPKRHLLTTGWSVFVGSKRLRAGDSVLFIRDEKSQLMVGVRRANRQQTTLPSSVLSADSMHIGVLAAAAHASVNRTPFTVFYNPRACPADFVIPVNKYRKAIHGTLISVGMRFGMMFETEESGKRRYMGTIVGINDLDSLRWPGSKWRNLQVEWDEPGCGDKQNRVSAWDIETPESLFLFPSLTSGFKRPFPPNFIGGGEYEWSNLLKRPLIHQTPAPEIGGGGGNHIFPYPAAAAMPNLCSDQLIKMLIQSQNPNYPLPPQGGPSSLSSSSSGSPYLSAANVLEAANSARLQQSYSSQQLPTAQPSMQNNNPSTTQSSFLNQQHNTHYQVQQTNKPEEESRQTNKNMDQDTVGSTAPPTTTITDNKAAKTTQTEPAATSRRRHGTFGEVSQQLPTSSTISSVQCNKEKQQGSSSNSNQQQLTTMDVLPLPNNDNDTHRLTQQQPQPSLDNHHQFHDQSSQTTTTTTTSSAALLPPPPLETYQFHQLTNLDLPDHWLPNSVPSTTTTTTLQSLAGFPQSPTTLSMFGKLDPYLSSTLPDAINNPMLTPTGQDMWDHSQPHHQVPYHGNLNFGSCEPQPSMGEGGGLDSTTINDHSGIYSSLEMDHISNVGGGVGNNGVNNRFVVDPSAAAVSGYDGGQFGGGGGVFKEVSAGFQYSSDCIGGGNFNSSQDLQSQITSAASLVDSQAFSFQQELQDNSGGTSSSNVDFDECSLMQSGSWQPVATAAAAAPPPLRSFTKVQKAGSVGRSIDVTSFKSYDELRSAIECMFGLDGLLCDPRGGSGWKLVYVDFENDVLLVGDDPWEEFVSCVRCIRILSPSEVKQMSEEGLQLLNAQAANA